jgi:hypothetical protein
MGVMDGGPGGGGNYATGHMLYHGYTVLYRDNLLSGWTQPFIDTKALGSGVPGKIGTYGVLATNEADGLSPRINLLRANSSTLYLLHT